MPGAPVSARAARTVSRRNSRRFSRESCAASRQNPPLSAGSVPGFCTKRSRNSENCFRKFCTISSRLSGISVSAPPGRPLPPAHWFPPGVLPCSPFPVPPQFLSGLLQFPAGGVEVRPGILFQQRRSVFRAEGFHRQRTQHAAADPGRAAPAGKAFPQGVRHGAHSAAQMLSRH